MGPRWQAGESGVSARCRPRRVRLLGYARGEWAEWREKGKEGVGPSEGSWARVGFSWARQVGPSMGFGLGFQGRLGWAWVEFWAGLSSNSFSFLFLFLTTQTI